MTLTLAQIETFRQQALDAGLTANEAQGVVDALIMQAADLDGANKLAVALDMVQEYQRQAIAGFLDDMSVLRSDVMQRGAAVLASISDAEWDALIGGSDGNRER